MSKKSTSPMWGGRFEEQPADITLQINQSVSVDQRLYRQDIAGSLAHCRMLVARGILSAADGAAIEKGLESIRQEIESGTFVFRTELEDVHMNIESRLKELIGDAAGRLHTARSRNDQVATDFRLWLKEAIKALEDLISGFQAALDTQGRAHAKTVMPGFTHLQIAQPVTLALHLQAYADMMARDKGRFADCLKRLDECPLGACALAGTSYPIDRGMTAAALGFARPVRNTMDAVSSRDFALEFLAAASICAVHLSRLAEEMVLWSTAQFGYVRLADAYTTGSSIMPQKKNPDAAELVRAKSGRIAGNLMQLLMVMKALPLAYNKDMQDDKAAVFEAFDTLSLCLRAMTGMVETMQVKGDRMRADADNGFAMATALADWLVTALNMPFRDAHHVAGRIVKLAEGEGKKLHELSLPALQQIEPKITEDIFRVLNLP